MKYSIFLLISLLFSHALFAKTTMLTFPYSSNAPTNYAQSYDLYLPDKANSSTPLFVFVHGGYWVADDSDYGFGKKIAQHLTSQNFAVALLRYRLAPEYRYPSQINDISLGFSRLLQQQDNQSYNPSCIIAAGHSAGAHLVSLMALNPQYLAKHKLKATQLKRVLSISGVYDLNDASKEVSPRILQLYQSVFGSSMAAREAASPLSYVNNQSPHLLILSGSNDFPGFKTDAELFYQALIKAGKKNIALHHLKNRNHFQMVDTQLNNAELLRLVEANLNCE